MIKTVSYLLAGVLATSAWMIKAEVSAKELTARKKKWKTPKSRYKDGILAEYARHVSSASLGAVVE